MRPSSPDPRPTSVALVLLLAAPAGCGDEAPTVDPTGRFQVEETVLDFGPLRTGRSRTVEIEVENIGEVPIEVLAEVSPPGGAFTVEAPSQPVAPGRDGDVAVRFTPEEAGEVTATLRIAIVGGDGPIELPVIGVGTVPMGEVSTDRIEFAPLLPGTSTSTFFTLRNTGLEDLQVEVLPTTNVDRCGADVSVPAPFCIEIPENATVPVAAEELEDIRVRFAPTVVMESFEGQVTVRFCNSTGPECQTQVTLVGSSTDEDLSCSPESLDFGTLNPGVGAALDLTCTNVGNLPLDSVSVARSANTDAAFRLQGGFPLELQPGESAQVAVVFQPEELGAFSGAVRVTSAREGRPLREDLFPVMGVGGGPDLEAPEGIAFGEVSTLAAARRRFPVANRGTERLEIRDAGFRDEVGGTLRLLDPLPVFLEPGESTLLRLEAMPTEAGRGGGFLILTTNDRDSAMKEIPVGVDGAFLPPCRYTTNAPPDGGTLNLEALPESVAVEEIFLENTGATDCLVTTIEFFDVSEPGRLLMLGAETDSHRLAPGQRSTLTIRFAPLQPGTVTGTLFIGTSATTESDQFREFTVEAIGL